MGEVAEVAEGTEVTEGGNGLRPRVYADRVWPYVGEWGLGWSVNIALLVHRVVGASRRGPLGGQPAALPTESLTPVGSIPAESQEEGALMCRKSANLDSAQRSYAGPLPLGKGASCRVICPFYGQCHQNPNCGGAANR